MSTQNLSSVATDVIHAYGMTATNVLHAYRFGGERLLGYVDERFERAVQRGASMLRQDLRSNMIGTQKLVTGYTVKGIQSGTDRAHSAVGIAVDLATKGVSMMANGAERLDSAANVPALETIGRVLLPAAQVVGFVAGHIEQRSGSLVQRVSGKPMPAQAVATNKLDATTGEAAAARKRMTRTATRRVNKAVATTADEASNVARRVARKARSAAATVGNAVAGAANETSNAARRVARKAKVKARNA